MPKRQTIAEGFEKYAGRSPSASLCWEWLGSFDTDGYARFGAEGKYHRGSRVSWVIHRGEIPAGLSVLHSCDNRGCCNPDHLFLGTQDDNVKDCRAKGRDRFGRGRGAYFHAPRKEWRMAIKINGKRIHKGPYKTYRSARSAYLRLARSAQ